MGLVKEPIGIDFAVYPSILTAKDKQRISAIIAEYKQTGKFPSKKKLVRYKSTMKAATDKKRPARTTKIIGSMT